MARKKWLWRAAAFFLVVSGFIAGRALRETASPPAAPPPTTEQAAPVPRDGKGKGGHTIDREELARREERHRQRIAELRAEAKEIELREQNKVREVRMSTLGVEGNLSPQLAKELDLTAEQVESLKAVIGSIRDEERQSFISRAKQVKVDGGEAGGRVKYIVRAKEDLGEGSRKQWADRIKGAIGEEKGERFISGSSGFDFYGDFGRNDIDIEYYRKNGERYVSYKYLVAEDGRLVGYGGGPLTNVNYTKWDIFPAGE